MPKATRLFLVSLLLLSLFGGCRKTERDDDTETLAAQNCALAYHLFDDAVREVHRFAMRDSLLNDTGLIQKFNSCIKSAKLSDTVAIFPLYLTLNYGAEGKECLDTFQRYGIIKAVFSGKHQNKGTEIIIEFEDYRRGDFTVEGSMTLVNLGLNDDGYMRYSWEVVDGLITGVNTNIEWTGDHTLTWVAGRSVESQDDIDDDVFEIRGTSDGRSSRGNTFHNEITTAYVSANDCEWFTNGRSLMTIPNLLDRNVNYGEGECENLFYLRRNDTYFEVLVP